VYVFVYGCLFSVYGVVYLGWSLLLMDVDYLLCSGRHHHREASSNSIFVWKEMKFACSGIPTSLKSVCIVMLLLLYVCMYTCRKGPVVMYVQEKVRCVMGEGERY
jgi:hypothetical protein